MNNYWSEFEYNKLKLLLNHEKVQSIMDVLNGRKEYDEYFPISVELHLTDLCNLKCPWCTDGALRKNQESLKLDTVKELFKQFGESNTGVTIEGGGEPTVHKQFSEIIRYGKEQGVDMGLITNGTINITDNIRDFRWIRVSLDSSNKDEYVVEKGLDRFEKVLDNLEQYCKVRDEKETYIGVGYVVTKRNYSDLEGIVDRLDRIGVDYIYFRPVEEAGDITPSIRELYDMKKKLLGLMEGRRIKFLLSINDRLVENNDNLPCVAHSLTSIIHANGDVALCEKRRHDEINLGNVNESLFSDIWNSDFRKSVSKKLLNPESQCGKDGGCSTCRITSFNTIFNNLEHVSTRKFI